MIRSLLGTDLVIDQETKQAFNLDTILLANFIKIPYKSKLVLDVGTGVGALMLYTSTKTKAKIIGVEIQANRHQQAVRNISLNGLDEQLSCFLGDVRDMSFQDVDVIISNPPFFKVSTTSNLNACDEQSIARHEIKLTLKELIAFAGKNLKNGGYFYMIHRPDRFLEIISLLGEHHLEIKRVRFVHPYLKKDPNHILILAIKKGHPGLKVDPPLILYHDKDVLTEDLKKIYGGI
ncbi:MAG: methyltransferase [Acholeplasmataceae bacterium]|nr:methyltransferase [Acholeplasmataceae bacterium]